MPQELLDEYIDLPSDKWSASYKRPDFLLAKTAILKNVAQGSVLDVGCWRGDFLSSLPENYQKVGVEPSDSASKISQKRGVRILCSSIESAQTENETFAAISFLDVVEHLTDPLLVLRKASRLLDPSGIILVSTGNTDSLLWRFMRLDYYYYYPEHVCFFNPKWFIWASKKLALEVVSVCKFSHFPYIPNMRLKEFLLVASHVFANKNFIWPEARKVLQYLYPFSRVVGRKSAPTSKHWPDHMFLILRPSKR